MKADTGCDVGESLFQSERLWELNLYGKCFSVEDNRDSARLRIHNFVTPSKSVLNRIVRLRPLRPKRLNEFRIPEKKQYRSEHVARARGISTDLLRWRFPSRKIPGST